MSTKTTFKRIALVAVASLGFGVLSTIAPANATESAPGTVTAINLFKVTTTPVINTAVDVNVGATIAAQTAAIDVTFKAVLTSYPAGGAVSVLASAAATPTIVPGGGATTYASQVAPIGRSVSPVATATTAGTVTATVAVGISKMTFTPTVAGTYVMTVWNDQSADNVINVAEVQQTISITVSSLTASALPNFNISTNSAAGTTTLAGVLVSSVGVTKVSSSGRIGVPVSFAPNYILTNNIGTGTSADLSTGQATLKYSVTNPAGTAQAVVTAAGGTTAAAGSEAVAHASATFLGGAAAVTETSSTKGSTVFFTPATAGTYTITVFHDGGATPDGLLGVGEAIGTSTVVIAADGLPSITFTQYGSTSELTSAAGKLGKLVKISLRNGTLAANLGATEVLTLTGPTGTVFDQVSTLSGTSLSMTSVDGSNGVTQTLTSANFNSLGDAYVNVGSTVAGTSITVSAVITGGTAAGASGSFSFASVSDTTFGATAVPAAQTNPNDLLGVLQANDNWSVKRGVATSVKASFLAGASSLIYRAYVTDTAGLITGLAGAQYTMVTTTSVTAALVLATTTASFSVAIPATTSTVASGTAIASLFMGIVGTVSDTLLITAPTAVATTSFSNPTADAATYSVRAAVASSNKHTVTVIDQFGNVMPNIAVTAAITGRNSATVVPTMITDANGQASYTLADVYTGTTLLTDTLTFTPATGATSSVGVNYATYAATTTITMTTPDSAAATASGIAGATISEINAGDGAESTTAALSVVLKDANGATQPAGIPVVWSIAGNTGSAIVSTKVTTYTDSSGKASTSAYAWLNGNATVTATSGGITASGIVYFKQTDTGSSEARTVSATSSGNVVTAKVTDRFGNPIKGTTLTASRVGTGTFTGTSSTTGVTGADGTVDFVLSNGTADVTVGFSSTTFGQSFATKGYFDAGITALTAFTAGTTALAAAGVGASYDAAGVNSVKVLAVSDTATLDTANAAADAAAEATDAANAATDAANAAAEAADAATAAAQDAADAVAALSVQVSEQIAALRAQNDSLRKQLIALTNLIIKIQKKVKA
jgi:hypothetical protein